MSSHKNLRHERRRPAHGLYSVLLLALVASACTCVTQRAGPSAPSTTQPSTPAIPLVAPPPVSPDELRELRWVLGGSRLLVAGRWLLDSAKGEFTPLPYSTRQPLEEGGTLVLQVALSPAGERIALSDGQTLRLGPVAGPLEPPMELPTLLPPQESGREPAPRSALFWLSEQQLALHQVDRETGEEPRCALLEPGTRRWSKLPDCLSSHEVWSVESGPGGWLAVYSGAEGAPGLDLLHYTPGRQPSARKVLSWNLYPDGDVRVQFATEGMRLYLATPCALERRESPPCERVETESSWRLYEWEGPGGGLALRRKDLPPNAVPHPSGTRWAWPDGQLVCIGDAASPARCFTPPG